MTRHIAMSVEEKLQEMEALWNDLCWRAGGVQLPDWHGNVLAEREAAYRRGEETAEEWEQAKKGIKNQV